MSDREQRELVRRGLTLGVAAVGVSFALPAISVSYDAKYAEAEFRDKARRLADAAAPMDGVRAEPGASPLFEHAWVRRVGYAIERDPRASLSRYSMRDRDGAAVASVASFKPRHMKQAEEIAAEHRCMSEAIYYEARSESTSGQLGVAEVVANRVKDHRFPNTICDVVYQGATRTTGCQFTFTCDGALSRKPHGQKWEQAKTIAAHVMMDLHEKRTGAATHYHATYVDPVWNSGLIRTSRIGLHIFYRFPRGAEWATARARLAERRGETRKPSIVPASASVDDLNSKQLNVLSPAP
ncbi:MAG: cell wall hydrolase [Pseudomonadota bacterium]